MRQGEMEPPSKQETVTFSSDLENEWLGEKCSSLEAPVPGGACVTQSWNKTGWTVVSGGETEGLAGGQAGERGICENLGFMLQISGMQEQDV